MGQGVTASPHITTDVILGHCVLLVAGADLEEEKMLRESRIGNRDCHRGNSPIDDSNKDQEVYF